MRLVTYEQNGQRSIGTLTNAGISDLPTASGGALPADMLTFLQQGDTVRIEVEKVGVLENPVVGS